MEVDASYCAWQEAECFLVYSSFAERVSSIFQYGFFDGELYLVLKGRFKGAVCSY